MIGFDWHNCAVYLYYNNIYTAIYLTFTLGYAMCLSDDSAGTHSYSPYIFFLKIVNN